MKKRVIRLLAMLLCVMSFVSLLPPAALAADANTDGIKEVIGQAAEQIKEAAKAKPNVHTIEERYSYKLSVSRNSRVMLVDYNWYRHGSTAYPFPVKFCWYYRRPGSSKWVRMKKATKYYITFAARGKNGYTYRLKTIEKKDSGHVMLSISWKLKVY